MFSSISSECISSKISLAVIVYCAVCDYNEAIRSYLKDNYDDFIIPIKVYVPFGNKDKRVLKESLIKSYSKFLSKEFDEYCNLSHSNGVLTFRSMRKNIDHYYTTLLNLLG